ncbi:tetratricopeptide repeat protein [Hymenobacter profundi]|uniref:DUF3808 domain-containing protein n=1 Tax=Hymenobacter profundi TaxID=1982110 RepID=A0ABS6WYR5_9BACT|nr:DUF3808 domain-containing protein [Hymenobacter profundi]MBW3128569.1 DUF3808 domain-containing protein [Hymenobacter profundi]
MRCWFFVLLTQRIVTHVLLAALLLAAHVGVGASSREAPRTLTPTAARAYAELLKLRPATARVLLRNESATAAGTLLVQDCIDFAELLVSQDAGRYAATVAAQDQRLALLEKQAGALPDYARAEIRLHQAAAQVTFGHEIRGAWSLRQAYQQMQAVAQRYPAYLPARKTLGMLQFFIGSLPENYRWFLKLLGLPGSVETGLRNLTAAARSSHDFQFESRLILALLRETYLKDGEATAQQFEQLAAQQPDNLLLSYLTISQRKKLHHTAAALVAYRSRPTGAAYLPLPYLHHMAADLLLYQGQYAASETENQQFLREYRGQHYRKDAYFKLYLAAWLGGNQTAATQYRRQIDAQGRDVLEEDHYAQRFYDDALPLHRILTRARLQTDGGYYPEALATLRTFVLTPTTPLRDRLEWPYRQARAWHLHGQPDSARRYYARTITLAGTAPYYFAPQSALQLGYLYQTDGKEDTARSYFQKALSYPKHEYKNSTDTKAKVALAALAQ